MLTFGSKLDIYEWFQEIQGWNRMDFLCNLINLCNPFELRFIGSCIEDKARADYNALRDQELKANSIENLEQFIKKCPPVDEFRCHISFCLVLLQSSNYRVASKLAELLDEKLDGLNLEHLMQAGMDAEVEQWMLMLTLAAYHPAFSFEKKQIFMKKLSEYERLSKKERKSARCWRSHRCSQQPHPVVKYDDCDEPEWRTGVNSDITSFQHYPGYHQRGYSYMGCPHEQYQGKHTHGNLPDAFTRTSNMRPSTFPTSLVSSTGHRDANFSEKPFKSNPEVMGLSNVQNIGRTNLSRPHYGLMTSVWTEPIYVQCTNSTCPTVSPGPGEYYPSHSTVSQPQTCSSATSVPAKPVMTTAICETTPPLQKTVLSGGTVYRNFGQKTRHFTAPPNSESSDGRSGPAASRSLHETQNQGFKARNRSKSGESNSKTTQWQKNRRFVQSTNSQKPLRESASAPVLPTKKETPMSTNEKNTKQINLKDRKLIPLEQNVKPLSVSVNVIPKNKKEDSRSKVGTCFRLKVEWSDETQSECDRSVEEMVQFYKQITGKIGKNASNLDTLTRQNNQIHERRKKLEEMFSENLMSCFVTASNIDDFTTFFNYQSNFPPLSSTLSLPFKKRKCPKPRVVLDGSSSSSSMASPPLVNNARSGLLSPPNASHVVSVSPLSKEDGVSTSSVLSSPNSTISTSMASQNDEDGHGDSRNDPFLKVFYWLQERNMSRLYTHFKKFTFDQFCKLEPTDIDSMRSLTSEDKASLNALMSQMSSHVNENVTELDIDMGTLSLSSKDTTSNSDILSDGGRTLDIKTILDDVAKNRSEDEKSGSNQSVPVAFAMPDSSISDANQSVASNTYFSFEFDSSSAALDPTVRKHFPKNGDEASAEPTPNEALTTEKVGYFYSNSHYVPEPDRAWSNTDIVQMTERPQMYYPSRSAPPFAPVMYYAKPEHVMVGYHLPSQTIVQGPTNIPVSVNAPYTQPPTMTLPSPMQPISGQKQTQYTYTVTTSSCTTGTMHPAPAAYYPVHSMTSPTGELPTRPHLLYLNKLATPSPVGENPYPIQTIDPDSRLSPISSDPESLSKLPDGSLPMGYIPAENVMSNRPGAGPTNCYYNPAPVKFHYNPQPQWVTTVQHHPLGSTYSDPFTPKKPLSNDFEDYPAISTSSGAYVANGYPELRPMYAIPQNVARTRATNPTEVHAGDAPKRISCYNCGRKGHNASTCSDPNAVDTLGTEFHLKISVQQSKAE